MASSPIKVAILGLGMSTTVFHAPFVLSHPHLFTLSTILERSATSSHSVARSTYPGVKVETSLAPILADPSIELVFVSTINDTHFEFAKACLDAGKHVVIEKPICPTSEEAKVLAALAKEKGLCLATYQNRRWDSDFRTVQQLVQSGAFGEISEFQSNYDRFKLEPAVKLWKEKSLPGSGAAYDLGSHLLDQILVLFGRPNRVTGIMTNSRQIGDPEVADAFVINLHYNASDKPGRKLPLIATARGSILSLVAPQLRFTIKGTDASFVKFGLDVQESQLKEHGSKAIELKDFGVEPENIRGTIYTASSPPKIVPTLTGTYAEFFKNVAQAIRANDPSLLAVKPEEAALTIEIIEAAMLSSKEGRTVDL